MSENCDEFLENVMLLHKQIQEIKKALQISEETLKQLQNKFDEIWRKP